MTRFLKCNLFPSGSPPVHLHTILLSSMCVTFPAQLILLALITLIISGKEYISYTLSLCNFLQSPDTSTLSGPNIFLSTLFSNVLSLCSSLMCEIIAHICKATCKMTILYILFLMFVDNKCKVRSL